MRVADLLKYEAGADGADVPIIYDIIKAKLEAGDTVLKATPESYDRRPDDIRQIFLIMHQFVLNHWMITLRWNTIETSGKRYNGIKSYELDELESWKLTKVGDHWELTL